MSLYLPPNFASDIQARDTSLVPIVVIGNYTSTYSNALAIDWLNDSLHISTNQMTYGHQYDASGTTYTTTPILLNIPSLKESIDLEKRNYKISNITLSLSNFPYEGKRFSDIVASSSLVNTEVRIFWWSPSTDWLYPLDKLANVSDGNIAFESYFGVIRRYDHDDEKVKLIVEDRSQSKLHIDLPTANLGTGPSVPEKYKNKPKPMVYGAVHRSPCVISNVEEGDTNEAAVKKLLMDSATYLNGTSTNVSAAAEITHSFGDSGLEFKEYPLYIYDDGYLSLNKYLDQDSSLEQNYSITAGVVEILGSSETASGVLSTWQICDIGKITPIWDAEATSGWMDIYQSTDADGNPATYQDGADGWIAGATEPNWRKMTDRSGDSFIQVYGQPIISDGAVEPFVAFKFDIKLNTAFDETSTYLIMKVVKGTDNQIAWRYGTPPAYWTNYSRSYSDTYGYDYWNDVFVEVLNYDGVTSTADDYPMLISSQAGTISETTSETYTIGVPKSRCGLLSGPCGETVTVDYRFHEFHVWQKIKVDNLFNRDFYANVVGRISDAPTAPQIINDIMANELRHSASDSPSGYPTWIYAFTVDKKINSKKLIQEIASASPFIPRFNNMGAFKFDVIPESGGTSDHMIYEEDVIDFSFTRSKIEDVKTRIEFKYNYDYGIEEFQSSITPLEIHGVDFLSAVDDDTNYYNPEYYGFKWDSSTGDMDHVDSTLIVDDERGNYIRDPDTAKAFASWLLLWHCNQHLIFNKLRLPLKYMNIEIGDILKFSGLIGGVVPYGIFYTANSYVNGQLMYPTFLVTKTNKTLEYVEISCEHLPNLQVGLSGCFGPATNGWNEACNHNPAVTIDDGSCYYPGYANECGECGSGDLLDCNDECGGNAMIDECGDCTGGTTGYDYNDGPNACEDCDGNPDGSLITDQCGDCVEPDNACVQDCAGEWGGDLVNDECGVCAGDGTTCGEGITSCAGTYGGTDTERQCYGLNYDSNICPWQATWDNDTESHYPYGSALCSLYPERCHDVTGSDYHAATGYSNGWWGYSIPEHYIVYPYDTGIFLHDPTHKLGVDDYYKRPTEGLMVSSVEEYCAAYNVLDGRCDDPNHEYYPMMITEANCNLVVQSPETMVWNNSRYKLYFAKFWPVDADNNVIPDAMGEIYFNPTGSHSAFDLYWFVPLPDSTNVPKIYLDADQLDLLNSENSKIQIRVDNLAGEESPTGHWYMTLSYWDVVTGGWINIYTDDYWIYGADQTSSGWYIDHVGFGGMNIVEDTPIGDGYSVVFKLDFILYIDEFEGKPHKNLDNELKFELIPSDCGVYVGDVNSDSLWNVLDVVTLVNRVLANTADVDEPGVYNACAGDINGDSVWNVLDVVTLVNCVLGNTCAWEFGP